MIYLSNKVCTLIIQFFLSYVKRTVWFFNGFPHRWEGKCYLWLLSNHWYDWLFWKAP